MVEDGDCLVVQLVPMRFCEFSHHFLLTLKRNVMIKNKRVLNIIQNRITWIKCSMISETDVNSLSSITAVWVQLWPSVIVLYFTLFQELQPSGYVTYFSRVFNKNNRLHFKSCRWQYKSSLPKIKKTTQCNRVFSNVKSNSSPRSLWRATVISGSSPW